MDMIYFALFGIVLVFVLHSIIKEAVRDGVEKALEEQEIFKDINDSLGIINDSIERIRDILFEKFNPPPA